MRNVLKAETLERRFPLLSVENGCIVNKDADLTVAFEVELPELYTVTEDEYETMHSSWIKAMASSVSRIGSSKKHTVLKVMVRNKAFLHAAMNCISMKDRT